MLTLRIRRKKLEIGPGAQRRGFRKEVPFMAGLIKFLREEENHGCFRFRLSSQMVITPSL